MYYRLGALIALIVFLASPAPTMAQTAIDISGLEAELAFPEQVTFRAHIESGAPLKSIVLEYGVDKQTCGTVIAKVFPDVPDSLPADVEWTWEMRQSGSEPAGSTIWYRWRVTDARGNEQVSTTERVTWLDDIHEWRSATSDNIRLHWYEGDAAFADAMLGASTGALARLSQSTGVTQEAPIDMYLYASNDDLRAALLYEPGWVGGVAFAESNIVLMGVGPDNLEWGTSTAAHELTHVLVGHLTFSCLGRVPTWLNEGIAVYGEGGLDETSAAALETAIQANQVMSVRVLSGQFTEHADKANLSYSQSYSLVNFLIGEYGSEKLLALFGALRDGRTIEEGLRQVYDLSLDDFEDRWRAAVGAAARPASATQGVPATAAPTVIPTYQPAAPLAAGAASGPEATPTASAPVAAAPAAAASGAPSGMLLLAGGAGIIVIIGLLVFTLRRRA
jgi:hypothetical protein